MKSFFKDVSEIKKRCPSPKHDFTIYGDAVVKFDRRIIDIKIEPVDHKMDSFSMVHLKLISQYFLWHKVRWIVTTQDAINIL